MTIPTATMLLLMIIVTIPTVLGSTAPPSCPLKCTCSNRFRMVRCENLKLQKIPDGIPPTVTELYLGSNLIDAIPEDAFVNLSQLRSLSLKGNLLIPKKVHLNAFRGLKNLKYLFLTNNKLDALDKEHFKDLTGLTRLYLSQNYFTEIPDLQYCTNLSKMGIDNNQLVTAKFPDGFKSLVHLSTLVLSNNPITDFKFSDVSSLWDCDIRKIDLSRCELTNVDVQTFNAFKHLQSLDLSYNVKLSQEAIRNTLNGLAQNQITYLGLAGVIQTPTIPPDLFQNVRDVPLQTLDMSHMDKVNVIQNGTFGYLVDLEYLDLSHSKLETIDDGAFGGADVKLKRLKLAHNDLAVVPTGLPPSLEVLDLSFNFPEDLQRLQFWNLGNLKNLSLANCKIHTIPNDAFVGVGSLLSLDLSYNGIGGSSLGNSVLYPLVKLRSLTLKKNDMTDIPTQSKLFAQLSNLIELDMSENMCRDLERTIFSNLTSLKKLDLSGNVFGQYIQADNGELFSHLINLEELIITNSQLYQLPMLLFHNLKSLKHLDLSNNIISEWAGGLFEGTKNLSFVDLSHNDISVVNETSVEDLPNHVVLQLTSNPFACWCDLIWFRNWLDEVSNTSRISLPGNDTYICNSPKDMINKPVLQFKPLLIQQKCFPPPWKFILTGAMSGLAAIILATVLGVYKYRWSLRLKIYKLRKRCTCGTNISKVDGYEEIPGHDEEPNYDVCVSYGPDEQDCNWVKQMLIPKIDSEQGGRWKVFFEERDALPNKSAIGQIADAIYLSRKVILVLTSQYVKDSRRDYEMELAFSYLGQRSMRSDDIVIPIILEHGVDVKAPRLLHPLFRNNLELHWTEDDEAGQNLFWRKLDDMIAQDPNNFGNIQA